MIFEWAAKVIYHLSTTLRSKLISQSGGDITFPGGVQMRVNIGSHLDIRMTKPFLHSCVSIRGSECGASCAFLVDR